MLPVGYKCPLGEMEEMTKIRHKEEKIRKQLRPSTFAPHLWFFPNDEICKGMFDLLHIRPYNLFLRSAYHSVPRKEKTLVSVGGGECRDLLKNRCSGIDYRRKKRMTTYYGLDGGLSS